MQTAARSLRKHEPNTSDGTTNASDAPLPPGPLTDEPTTDPTSPQSAPWKALFYFTTRSNVPVLALGIFCSIIAGAASPAQSYLAGRLFEGFTNYAAGTMDASAFLRYETPYVVYLVAVAGGTWLFHSLEFSIWLAFGELQAKSARDRLFHGLLEKEMEWFDMRKHGIGALLPRIQAQIRDLQLADAQPLGAFFALTATALMSVGQAFLFSWKLTLVTLAMSPVIVSIILWLGRNMQVNLDMNQDELGRSSKYISGAIGAIETVKIYNGQYTEREKYMTQITEAASSYEKMIRASGLQMAAVALLSITMFVQGFYYGGVLIRSGKLSTGDVVTTFFSALGGFDAIQSILPQMVFLEKGRTAGLTLRNIMMQVQHGAAVRKQHGLIKPGVCIGDIELKDVCFAYPSRPDQLALDKVNMYIPGGELTFLVGRSGSGKSTLGQLLMRFYASTSGSIALDGMSIEKLDVKWLRSNITLVEQQSCLFQGTLKGNIAFGRGNGRTSDAIDVIEAAEFALLKLAISDMPDGFDTMMGLKGLNLSGGQRQRVALARAWVRDTPILFLDESTSALDQTNRALMMEAIRHWRRGKTTVIITHDISQILPDDYLYLLDQGTVVEEGYRKHLEVVADSPFAAFVHADKQGNHVAPKDRNSLSPSAMQFGTPTLPVSSPYDDGQLDVLEAQLEASENRRTSFIPIVFKDTSRRMMMLTQGKLSLARSRVESSISEESSEAADGPLRTARNGDSRRLSQQFQALLEKTGRLAKDKRSTRPWIRRRLSMLESSSPVIGRFTIRFGDKAAVGTEEGALSKPSLMYILRTIWPNLDAAGKALLILGFWGAAIHAVATPVVSYILSKLMATYSQPGGDPHMALVYSLAMLGTAIVDTIHTFLFRAFLGYAGRRWVDSMRANAVDNILNQPRYFFDKPENSVNNMVDTLDQAAEQMVNILASFAGLTFIAALMCASSVVWALATSWKMTLIALAVTPCVLFVTKMFAAVCAKWESLSSAASESASTVFSETFTNIKTVRALTLEDHFLQRYLTATTETLVVGLQRSFFVGFFYGLSDSVGSFSLAMIFYVAAKLATQGTPVNDVIQVAVMLTFAITNISVILECIPQIGQSQECAARVLRLAHLPADSHEQTGQTHINAIGDIEYHNVHFSYPSSPSQTVLNGINLHLRRGTSTAIVGGSGSGKSTIANLLLDLYTPALDPTDSNTTSPRSCLTIGGRNIRHIHTPSLRSLVAVVSQTPTLFSASIAENITYGLSSTSPFNTSSEIEAAARQAGIHDFITSLPQSYDTLIGEGGGGTGLSGGQAQRITIARALIRKPSLLILDEATSALDVESAALIRRTVKKVLEERRGEMTVVIITHAREMMGFADEVVVLEKGMIVERGGFKVLMGRRRGKLRELLSGGVWNGGGEED